ncbi:tyramine/octopamine receptor-like, partial [Dendronephthya gigantea]|uniref:tyramine/octopamine receptor-like n=1 Tax=Dendronephthya gigantea TaxID=151771 RepID=UPI00106DA019
SSFDIFTGVVMILIIVISLTGNIMILYAFLTTPKLRMVNNYFLMNLTLSDIITASLVIPFDVDIKINGISSWTHGIAMCKIWTNAYTVSVPTSILTLCVVSIDRYQAISNPLKYRAGMTLTRTKAVCLITGVWGLSVFMALLPVITGPPLNETLSRDLPPIARIRLPETNNGETKDVINTGIEENKRYGDSKTAQNQRDFYKNAHERNRTGKATERNRISHKYKKENNGAKVGQFGNADEKIIKGCDKDRSNQNNEEENLLNENNRGKEKERKWHEKMKRKIGKNDEENYLKVWTTNRNGAKCDKKRKNDEDDRRNERVKRMGQDDFRMKQKYQTKVARHFSVIVLVQLLCWYPFSAVGLVYNLCDGCEHKLLSSSAQYFLLAIGYLSCAVNPYLYAYQQRSFRQVFKRMFGIKGK